MRVRDDPRAAAELFCRQNGVTDAETIDLLEETLRGLYSPSRASPPPPPLLPQRPLPEASTMDTSPLTASEKVGDSVARASHTPATRRAEARADDGAEDVEVRNLGSSEASDRGDKDTAFEAGGPVQTTSESSDLAAARKVSDANQTSRRAVSERPQAGQHHEQERERLHQNLQNDRQQVCDKDSDGAGAGTAPADSPAVLSVTEVAARMRDAAEASHDPADPSSVLVDLVVNGHPAPLAFRIPRKPARIGPDRCHELHALENDRNGHGHSHGHGHGHGRGGGAAEDDEEARGAFRLDGEGSGEEEAVHVSPKSGGKELCNERDDHEEAGEQVGNPQEEELQEQAVTAAAREWCGAFGTNRAEDIAFVEAEIRKTVLAAEAASAAAAAAAAAAAEAAAAATAALDAERNTLVSSGGDQIALERPKTAGLSGTVTESDGGEARQESVAGGGRGKKERGRAERAERLTMTSVLAPDVEKGTSMFWVKADPSLTELYVTAGFSALELSEAFCREHGLGPSQVPLVAWKVLEAYPLQMEAARTDGTLPPARTTLGYASGQREVQVACVLLATALLWVTRRRLARWLAPGKPAVAASHQQRRKRGTLSAKLWAFASPVLPSWAAHWQRTKRSRGHQIAIRSSRERKGNKPPASSDARDDHGVAARRDTPLAKNRHGTPPAGSSATASPTTKTNRINYSNGDDEAADGGDDSDAEGSSPPRSPSEPWAPRLSSWAEAVLFESGRLVGASVRALARPLAFARGGTAAGASDAGETETSSTPAAKKVKVGRPLKSKGSRRAAKASGSSARGPKGVSGEPKPSTQVAPRKPSGGGDSGGKKKAPFAGGDFQRVVEGAGAGKKSGAEEVAAAGEAPAATETTGRSGRPRTWASVLDSLAKDPSNRFSEMAILSNAGHVLAKSDAFAIETHEACDWTRLFKSRKGDIIVGGNKFVVLSREEGSIIISSKAIGSKMIGSKTKSGSAVIGVYADLSKSEARESVAGLVDSLASAPVR